MTSEIELLLQNLTTEIDSFLVLRGYDRINKNLSGDIDCFIPQNQFPMMLKVLQSFDLHLHSFRPKALSIALNLGDATVDLDVHFSFQVRGIGPAKLFPKVPQTVIRGGIRTFTDEYCCLHALHISLIQNKGILSKGLSLYGRENIEKFTSQNHFAREIWEKIYSNRKINRLTLLVLIQKIYGSRSLLHLILSIIYFRKNANKTEFFAQICLSDFYLLLRKLKIELPQSEIKVILTSEKRLRFGFFNNQLVEITPFISNHTTAAKVKLFILKLVHTCQVIPFYSIPLVERNTWNKSRIVDSVFFGTPSIDQTLLIKYSQGDKCRLIKSSKSRYKNIIEYKNYVFLKEKGLSDYIPKTKLVDDILVIDYIERETAARGLFLHSITCRLLLSRQKSDAIEVCIENSVEKLISKEKAMSELGDLLDRMLRGRLHKMSKADKKIALTWSHGDLAPWNIIYSKMKYLLIDFEKLERREVRPLGYDIAHYLVAAQLFKRGGINKHTISKMEELWLQVMDESNVEMFKLNFVLVLISYVAIIQNSNQRLKQYDWIESALQSSEVRSYLLV